MSCQIAPELISSLLDRRLAAEERENALAHLETCRTCSAQLETMVKQRALLRKLETTPVPPELTYRLRVVASRERARQLARASLSTRVQSWFSRVRLLVDNVMRPMAMPVAGGMLSALVLFSLLTPNFSYSRDFSSDVSLDVLTAPDGTVVGVYGNSNIPRLKQVGNASPSDRTVVMLFVDPNGRVKDWSVLRGELTYDVKSIILLSKFTPATYDGKPIAGRILVTISAPTQGTRS